MWGNLLTSGGGGDSSKKSTLNVKVSARLLEAAVLMLNEPVPSTQEAGRRVFQVKSSKDAATKT